MGSRRGGYARIVLPHTAPADGKDKKVAWAVAWSALVIGVVMTLFAVMLPP
jgi:hypothetical protein